MRKSSTLARILTITGGSALAVLLSACGGGNGGGGSDPVTLTQIFADHPVQMSSCGSCHAPDRQEAGGPDLRTAESFFDSLVGRSFRNYEDSWFPGPTSVCSTDGDFPYVQPGNRGQSALLAAVVYAYSIDRCDGSFAYHSTQYPAGSDEDFLDQRLIDQLEDWIRGGAQL